MNPRSSLSLLILISISGILYAQSEPVNRAAYRLQASETDQVIKIDGLLDEEIWSEAETTTPFFRITPIDTGYARAQTEVMVSYDEEFIYMGITCYDPTPGKRPAES